MAMIDTARVTTVHVLSNRKEDRQDLKYRLHREGLVGPGQMWNVARGIYENNSDVLDYSKFDPSLVDTIKQNVKDEFSEYNYDDYTEAELDNYTKQPVVFPKEGQVAWTTPYSSNELPAKLISERYPDITMQLQETIDGKTSKSVYLHGGQLSTRNGKQMDFAIDGIPNTQREHKEKGERINVNVDETDQRYAYFYAPADHIEPDDLILNNGKFKVLFEDRTEQLDLYRVKSNGAKVIEKWTPEAVKNGIDKVRMKEDAVINRVMNRAAAMEMAGGDLQMEA